MGVKLDSWGLISIDPGAAGLGQGRDLAGGLDLAARADDQEEVGLRGLLVGALQRLFRDALAEEDEVGLEQAAAGSSAAAGSPAARG